MAESEVAAVMAWRIMESSQRKRIEGSARELGGRSPPEREIKENEKICVVLYAETYEVNC